MTFLSTPLVQNTLYLFLDRKFETTIVKGCLSLARTDSRNIQLMTVSFKLLTINRFFQVMLINDE